MCFATSIKPNKPTVELMVKRPSETPELMGSPTKTLLTVLLSSERLEKKLCTDDFAKSGNFE